MVICFIGKENFTSRVRNLLRFKRTIKKVAELFEALEVTTSQQKKKMYNVINKMVRRGELAKTDERYIYDMDYIPQGELANRFRRAVKTLTVFTIDKAIQLCHLSRSYVRTLISRYKEYINKMERKELGFRGYNVAVYRFQSDLNKRPAYVQA